MIRFELELLEHTEKILEQKNSANDLLEKLKKFFQKSLRAKDFEMFFYDELNEDLRKFSAGWMFSYNKDNEDYKSFLKLKKDHFIFNDRLLEFHKKNQSLVKLLKKSISKDENILYIPITQSGKLAGMVKLSLREISSSFLKRDIMLALKICVSMVAQVLLNFQLQDKMSTNVNFYQSMKNIAKVIESQYEVAYIMPVIGEILDRFAPEHLVYIFQFEGEQNNLLWPSKYSPSRLDEFLETVRSTKKVVWSEDKHTIAFPIMTEDGIFGAIVADSVYCAMSEKLKNYIEQLVYQASVTLDKANTYAEILKNATTDALTGLYNRGQFDKRVRQEIATARRNKTPLCCMMIDADFFKSVNDNYGHSVGDVVLKGISRVIIEQIRENDTASRYGGEEFIVLLPFTSVEEAELVAGRVRQAVERTSFDISDFKISGKSALEITISLGLALYNPEEEPEAFCERVDKALYQAKHDGRNCVRVAT